jgi:hypothetical protein
MLVVVCACASSRGQGGGGDDDVGGDDGADAAPTIGSDGGDGIDSGGGGGADAAIVGCAPSAWMAEDIGPARGTVGSIVVDRDGALHAAYVGAIDKLVYATKPVGGTWIHSTFREGVPFDDAMQFSIAVADDRTVHVAYTSEVGNNFPFNGWRLRHAMRAPGAGWSEQEFSEYYRVTNPVVAAGSEVHLFYSESGYLHDDAATPHHYLYPYGQAVSAVVRDGHVHVGLRRDNPSESIAPPVLGELEPGASFTFETFGTNGWAPALALAPDGAVHLAYYDGDQGMRHAAREAGATWQVEQVPMTHASWASPSIAVDHAGRVHAIIYTDGSSSAYTVRSPAGVWSPPTIVPLISPSLAVGPDDVVHIIGKDSANMRHMWGCPP